jgi:hypothetical protein
MEMNMKNIGFGLALIGVAGLAEGQLVAIVLIGIGALLMRGKDEKNIERRRSDSRPYFLP